MNAAGTGRFGEDLAYLFYQHCGYRCLARRWRRGGGEVDLVMARPGWLVFVEVKARGPGSVANAAEAVTGSQLRRLRALAARWCSERGSGGAQLRLDVVAVDIAGLGRGLTLRRYRGVG